MTRLAMDRRTNDTPRDFWLFSSSFFSSLSFVVASNEHVVVLDVIFVSPLLYLFDFGPIVRSWNFNNAIFFVPRFSSFTSHPTLSSVHDVCTDCCLSTSVWLCRHVFISSSISSLACYFRLADCVCVCALVRCGGDCVYDWIWQFIQCCHFRLKIMRFHVQITSISFMLFSLAYFIRGGGSQRHSSIMLFAVSSRACSSYFSVTFHWKQL